MPQIFAPDQTERFPQYALNKQTFPTEAEADYVCRQVPLGREITHVKMPHEPVDIMSSSSNENVWFYSDTDSEEGNTHEKMIMNIFKRHNTKNIKPEMDFWSITGIL